MLIETTVFVVKTLQSPGSRSISLSTSEPSCLRMGRFKDDQSLTVFCSKHCTMESGGEVDSDFTLPCAHTRANQRLNAIQ
jgi:hypothetical protein